MLQCPSGVREFELITTIGDELKRYALLGEKWDVGIELLRVCSYW